MPVLHDLILTRPLWGGAWHWLLFFTFALHLLFALLTVGTALLGVAWYVREHWDVRREGRGWERDTLGHLFVVKSLAIVLGVAPLLLMQMGRPVAFLGAVSLTAPAWLLIVPLLLVGLFALELVHWEPEDRPGSRRWLAVLGLAALLAVPGIFALVVSTAERPGAWTGLLRDGGRLAGGHAVHWFFRYLHVLGASALLAAALKWVRTDAADRLRRRTLEAWMLGALGFQAAGGVALWASVRPAPGAFAALWFVLGISAAVGLLAAVRTARLHARPGTLGVASFALVTLFSMLLGRQVLQDRVLVPLDRALDARAVTARAGLAPWQVEAVTRWDAFVDVPYEGGLTLYTRSCAFCHGAVANGAGDEAPRLRVPPEDLTALRLEREAFHAILRAGVPGTGMPPFGYYTQRELDGVHAFLRQAGLADRPRPAPEGRWADADLAHARAVWRDTCAYCHGQDGRPTAFGAGLEVPPPDLRAVSFTAGRRFEVISRGYPGTVMAGFDGLPEGTRWALVDVVGHLYRPRGPASE